MKLFAIRIQFRVTSKYRKVFISDFESIIIYQQGKYNINCTKFLLVKALSHGAIFLATCNAILLLVDVKLANTRFHHSLLIYS